ncbi:MAG: zinc ribbon domain-containing protein [Candidatus Methanoperedens sp.]|nr:zinc ribbon domain-containing protein [Candidatus Methanoperedens sp.]
MKKELQRPVVNAIFALLLIILVRLFAMIMLKKVDTAYSVAEIALSLAVVVILLRFMKEFNRQFALSSPEYPQVQSLVRWFIILLVILTLYGALGSLSDYLPYGIYYITFFLLALVPVYYLWVILYKNTDMFPELLRNICLEDNLVCSCGWENPIPAKFCNRCGLSLPQEGGK